jgi:hypothetical protein
MGMPALQASRIKKKWTPEILAMLGSVPDAVVARKIGLASSAARSMRVRLGVQVHGAGKRRGWLTDAITSRLGRESDGDIARSIGISRSLVHAARKTLGVAAFKKLPLCLRTPEWLTPEILERLGTEHDINIARDLGVSNTVVCERRILLGIASFESVRPRDWGSKNATRHRTVAAKKLTAGLAQLLRDVTQQQSETKQ